MLSDKIDDIDNKISTLNGSIGEINKTFQQASYSDIYSYDHGSVHARLSADEQKIKDLETDQARNKESTAFGRTASSSSTAYNSLDERLEDGESRIVAMQSVLNSAKESNALNKTGQQAYGSIDDRFEAIETEIVGARGGLTNIDARLDNIEANATSLADNKISTSAIANNLSTQTAGKVLDASQGYAL